MSRRQIILITVGVMLSVFMGSMESTVVATAMPTIVSQLGGLEKPTLESSWVISRIPRCDGKASTIERSAG